MQSCCIGLLCQIEWTVSVVVCVSVLYVRILISTCCSETLAEFVSLSLIHLC